MEILVERIAKKNTYTISKWYVNGMYFCDGIEDTDRGLCDDMSLADIRRYKIQGKTAIPRGTYIVTLKVKSPKYSKIAKYKKFCEGYMPRLLNVKGYEGILIHPGNTAEDTEGCLIPGQNKVKGKVINSTDTWMKLYAVLKEAEEQNDTIRLTIR